MTASLTFCHGLAVSLGAYASYGQESAAQILLFAALIFFSLWTALLARLKGYSATCWFMGGGVVGVLLLCRLPLAGPGERAKKTKGNRLGLFLSLLWLPGLWFALHHSKWVWTPY